MLEQEYREQYYRVYAKIDLDALLQNITNTRKLLRPETKLMVIIKANGYGHGAVPLARALDSICEQGKPAVDAYGVAVVEEGIRLRKAGIRKPILVLGANPAELAQKAVEYDISMTVCDAVFARAMSDEAVRQGKKARLHIKLDTGMGRIGFAGTEEDAQEIAKLAKLPGVVIEGLFSHFARADEIDKTMAKQQFERFLAFRDRLAGLGVKPELCHIANSAGIIEMPEVQLDMVRSGISTYGLYPSEDVDKARLLLTPIMELKSHVSFVKEVPAGFPVGYGSTFVSGHPMRIATVPVGYADGFPRMLSNRGFVLLHGKRVPVIGRICMDQFMIDVTELDEVRPGDIVTLVGRDGDAFLPVEEPAGLAGSFSYEFVCGISERVPRIFYREGKPVSMMTIFAE